MEFEETDFRAQSQRKELNPRYLWIAWVISIGLHASGILAALLVSFLDPPRQESEMDVILQTFETPATETTEQLLSDEAQPVALPPQVKAERSEPKEATIVQPLPLKVSPVTEEEADLEMQFSIPDDILEREWTPEEAYGILSALIEEYPQYKNMVMREMIAGHGFAPDTTQPINLYLEQMLGGSYRPSWEKQRHTIEGAFQSFDGVSGWRQNSNYGGGVNILGLIDFLINLIKGEK